MTFKTSVGKVFTRVNDDQFGLAWKDESGMVWGPTLIVIYTNEKHDDKEHHGDEHWPNFKDGIIQNSHAVNACKAPNDAKVHLPTKEDFDRLVSYFDLDRVFLTDYGKAELYKILPDMRGRMFWTSTGWSSSKASSTPNAYAFNGQYPGADIPDGGGFSGQRSVIFPYSVRCVHSL